MIIYNDDELCIICVVNYNTHARIVSIYGYIVYTFRGSVSRHENSSAIAYSNIVYCWYIPRLRTIIFAFWTETRSLGLHRCSCCMYTAIDSKRNNRVFTRFSSEKRRRRTLHEIPKSNFVNAHIMYCSGTFPLSYSAQSTTPRYRPAANVLHYNSWIENVKFS